MTDDTPRDTGAATCEDALAHWVGNHKPHTVLTLYDAAHPLPVQVTQQLEDAEVVHLAPAAECLNALGTRIFDAAIVLCALETLPMPQAATILSRLRDVHARRLIVAVRTGDQWPDLASRWGRNDLFAYGLRCVGHYGEAATSIDLYRFDLYDYKSVPDWLNARNWAHPELWGKHRW